MNNNAWITKIKYNLFDLSKTNKVRWTA